MAPYAVSGGGLLLGPGDGTSSGEVSVAVPQILFNPITVSVDRLIADEAEVRRVDCTRFDSVRKQRSHKRTRRAPLYFVYVSRRLSSRLRRG